VTVRACLVDVYETLIAYDSEGRFRQIGRLAGVNPVDLHRNQQRYRSELDTGALSTAEAFRRSLTACGVGASAELVAAVADPKLMTANCRPYSDAIPFLDKLRSLGIPIALVSNCPDSTRTMLTDLGLIKLANHVTLSCEIGYLKPSPEIYVHAFSSLGIAPEDTVMIDDQAGYCAGAEAVGVRAIHLARDGLPAGSRFQAVRSLHEIIPTL
jgi:HAD superfamily hydrolase (TIGR01509 family)